MGSPVSYPKRPSHFALKAVRAMVKTCVANEFGPEVFSLVTVIAATEDAAHYRRPVTFHGGQLMPLIGVTSETTFKRVRQRAVESGWLVYIPGAKRKPASYFVTIPNSAQGLDDKPSDEGEESGFSPDSGSHSGPNSGPPVTQNPTRIRTESGLNPDLIRPTFIPIPFPVPDPVHSPPENVCVKEKRKAFVPPTIAEVRAYCDERKKGIDPERFVDHYTARGWIMNNGKKVQDWQACVRTWEKNNGRFESGTAGGLFGGSGGGSSARHRGSFESDLAEALARQAEGATPDVPESGPVEGGPEPDGGDP